MTRMKLLTAAAVVSGLMATPVMAKDPMNRRAQATQEYRASTIDSGYRDSGFWPGDVAVGVVGGDVGVAGATVGTAGPSQLRRSGIATIPMMATMASSAFPTHSAWASCVSREPGSAARMVDISASNITDI
jgi:hypothetical protein